MNSKIYFSIAGVFIALYVLTSLGVIVGLPEGVHRVFTVLFVLFVFVGLNQKKHEKENSEIQNKDEFNKD